MNFHFSIILWIEAENSDVLKMRFHVDQYVDTICINSDSKNSAKDKLLNLYKHVRIHSDKHTMLFV